MFVVGDKVTLEDGVVETDTSRKGTADGRRTGRVCHGWVDETVARGDGIVLIVAGGGEWGPVWVVLVVAGDTRTEGKGATG